MLCMQVTVTIVTDWSTSEIQHRCRGNITCVRSYHDQNTELLRLVTKTTAEELELLGVPKTVFSKIIIMPFCRLGSDYEGKEHRNPCAVSFFSAQYHATYFGYTLVGPYHKVCPPLFLEL